MKKLRHSTITKNTIYPIIIDNVRDIIEEHNVSEDEAMEILELAQEKTETFLLKSLYSNFLDNQVLLVLIALIILLFHSS